MIPRTFPSILGALGETKMVVYVLPSVSGLQAWKDYIPVKGITTENTAVQNTYANDGYQVMSPLEDISTKQAWKDYIPVFEDASYTKAWSTDAGGYIPASGLFSVYSLFANNEQGVWYDPSDLTTLFQDAAGTTPVTAVEQPVGLMLDKSKGLVLGPELVTNGDFSNGTTGWATNSATLSDNAGRLQVVTTAAAQGASQSFATVSGRRYLVSVTVVSATANYNIGYGNGFAQGQVYDSGALSGARTFTASFVSNGTSTVFWLYAQAAGTFIFDNISVRELPGNHAYQTTSANRPTLSARYNLLTKTEQFDDAAWVQNENNITANSTPAPDGTITADTIIPKANSAAHWFAQNINITSGNTYTFSIYIKPSGYNYFQIAATTGFGASDYVNFNVSSGTIGNKLGIWNESITSVGSGWYKISITRTAATSGTGGFLYAPLSSDAAGRLLSYTGDGTSGIYVWGADLRVANDGVGIPAYQRVNTATDYDTVGFPTYLRFNGSSSAMMTNTITPNTDKAQVFAGVRKLSDVMYQVPVELSANVGGNNGSFMFHAPDAAGTYLFRSVGTSLLATAEKSGYPSPITNVISGLGNISGDSAILRVNGTQVASSNADQGTGNYLAYPLYIGARAGTSLWFNGRVYSMIVRFGSNLTTAQITNTEKYVNSKTKAY